MKIISLVGIVALLLSACSSAPGNRSTEDDRLTQLMNEYFETMKHFDPAGAAYFNVEEDLGKFGEYPSQEFFNRADRLTLDTAAKINLIDASKLSPKSLLTYRLFKEGSDTSVRGLQFPHRYLEFGHLWNRLHQYIDEANPELTGFPFDSVRHYEAFVKKSEGFPLYIDRQIALLKEGIQKNIVQTCEVTEKTPGSYTPALEKVSEKNPFYSPITAMPKEFSDADKARLSQEFKGMIQTRIVPGVQKFDRFFRAEYMPHCRKQFGLQGLPNQKKWYEFEIESHTNLPMTAKEVHALGLKEVLRITRELEKVKNQLGYQGSLVEFRKHLQTDPDSFFKKPEELISAFSELKAKINAKLPRYFELLPKSDFRIVEGTNPEAPAGIYDRPTELKPYGRFMINTHNLKSVAKSEVTTLFMHETIPGHHLQQALQYELKDQISEYQRKLYFSTAFVEGWALYVEHLGYEMGMYEDPLQRLGNLNFEMLRATRLVVDSGIHGFNWSKKRALKYMNDHLSSSARSNEIEVNRYSIIPGQALAYKVGELKILELRHKAEQVLGPKFDIREFHRIVIGQGTVSLSVLESNVNNYIATFANH